MSKKKKPLSPEEFAKIVLDVAASGEPCPPEQNKFLYSRDGDHLEFWNEVPVTEAY